MSAARPLRLLTLNALMKGDVRPRLRILATLLEQAEYDVVCLQEVLVRGNAQLLRRLARSYPHHACTGPVLLEGGLLVLSRLPLFGYRFTRFPMTRPLRPELLMRKGAQTVLVEAPGGTLAVVNTHLSANRDGDWSPGNRYTRVQRGELHHLAGAVSRIDPLLPVVLVGDLNVPRTSPALAEFLARTGLVDARAGDPEPTFRPTSLVPEPPAIDHVLLRPGLTARTRLVFQEPVALPGGRQVHLSDHYGVEAELRPG